MRPELPQTSFARGEVSPHLFGRHDLAPLQDGVAYALNVLPLIEGPITKRPGTRFLGEPHPTTAVLVPFVVSRAESYYLALGDARIDVWSHHGQLAALSLTGGPLWPQSALRDADGRVLVRWTRLADTMWLTCRGQPPLRVQRQADGTFAVARVEPQDGPWDDENLDPSKKMWASASTGTVTLKAVGHAPFTAGHVGMLVRLWLNPLGPEIRPWEPQRNLNAGDVRISDGNWYRALDGGTTGTVRPVHTEGRAWDHAKAAGIEWEYLHSGYGILQITTVTNPTTAQCTVLRPVPDQAVGASNASYRWQFQAWGAAPGWPEGVALAFGRLAFLRGRHVWFSRANGFNSFADRTAARVLADDGLSLVVTADGLNTPLWAVEMAEGLLVGYDGGEVLIRRQSDSRVFGATDDGKRNVEVVVLSAAAGARVRPVRAYNRLITADDRTIKEVRAESDEGDRAELDLLTYAGHLLTGRRVLQLEHLRAPHRVLVALLDDGSLLTCTYEPQQEVVGWARFQAADGGVIRAIVAIPRPDHGDALHLLVERPGLRSLERWELPWTPGQPQTEARHLDCHLDYEGPPTSTIAGLDYLVGRRVMVLADGAEYGPVQLTSGTLTLPYAVRHARVGLAYDAVVDLLPAVDAQSLALGLIGPQRADGEVVLWILDTGRLAVGDPDGDGPVELPRYRADEPTDTAPALRQGFVAARVAARWDRLVRLRIAMPGIEPATILGVYRRGRQGAR